jgi:hypothetical protein
VNIENISLFDSKLLGIMLLFDILNNKVIRIEVATRLSAANGLKLAGTHRALIFNKHIVPLDSKQGGCGQNQALAFCLEDVLHIRFSE